MRNDEIRRKKKNPITVQYFNQFEEMNIYRSDAGYAGNIAG